MRIKNSIKNIYVSILTQFIITFLGFISRRVFLNCLGTEYLGVNGLLSNVLSMLSLVEGGIGTSIVYNLYKPLADNDEYKIISLIQLYKRIYSILAVVVFGLSLMLYPFLGVLMKDKSSITSVNIIYFIFVFKNVISYLNAHKWSLINADQKGYVLAKYNLIFNIVTTISKIIVLITTKDYIIFLLIEIIIFIVQNLWNGKIVNEKYPYIKTNKKYILEKEVKNNLEKNVKALFIHNVGGYCVYGTDNILISAFVNIKSVGLYSNYTMVIDQLSSLITPILNGIADSVGNLLATESKNKSYEIFKITYFINFWIYSVSTIFLYNLLEPFIEWWLGKGLLLNKLTLIVILINFYVSGMRKSIMIFKNKAGIFDKDKYIPLIESGVNLVSSLILVKYFGLAGIFMGTTISSITFPLFTQSKLVYNKIFNKSVLEYFKKYIKYIILTLIVGGITSIICFNIKYSGFIGLMIKGLICLILPNIIYIIIFYKTIEFSYIREVISELISNRYKRDEMKII